MELSKLPTGTLSFKIHTRAKPLLIVSFNRVKLKNLYNSGSRHSTNSLAEISPLISGKKGSKAEKMEQAKKEYYKPVVVSTGYRCDQAFDFFDSKADVFKPPFIQHNAVISILRDAITAYVNNKVRADKSIAFIDDENFHNDLKAVIHNSLGKKPKVSSLYDGISIRRTVHDLYKLNKNDANNSEEKKKLIEIFDSEKEADQFEIYGKENTTVNADMISEEEIKKGGQFDIGKDYKPSNKNFNEKFATICKKIVQEKIDNDDIDEDGTGRGYTTFINNFSEFEELKYNKSLSIKELRMDVLNDFINYQRNKTKSKTKQYDIEGYSIDYLKKQKKHLNMFIEVLRLKGLIAPEQFNAELYKRLFENKKPKDKTVRVNADIALSLKQLGELYRYKFNKNEEYDFEEYDLVRDTFLVGSLCGGLRPVDYSRLQSKIITRNINGNLIPIVQTVSKKTHHLVDMPAHDILLAINKKYGGKFPKCQEWKISRTIKEIGLLLKWTDKIDKKVSNPKERKVSEFSPPFYSMLAPKTARKTFCTIAYYDMKLDIDVIKEFSGHDNEKEVLTYIVHRKNENIETMYNALQALKI